MSEFIDNVEEEPRVQAVLEFVKRVRDGEDPEAIATEYDDSIGALRPYDVLAVEDIILREGADVDEIKAEIEPILTVFEPALESFSWDRPNEGHPIDNMLRENRAIESHLSALTRLAADLEETDGPPLSIVSTIQSHIKSLQGVEKHFVRKENELFPHLEDHWKHYRPLGVMWSIHDEIRSQLSTVESMAADPGTTPEKLVGKIQRLTMVLRGLIYKEEQIVFPVAMSTLSENQWELIQQECKEIGYFEIDPTFAYTKADTGGNGRETESARANSGDTNIENMPAGSVALGLETGSLTLQELEMVFETLPVDVTYVDENDRVRYFNNPDDRVFPRSSSIIGRTVQNCHPPESVDRVEEILDAFRAGEKDDARFWIQNEEDFVVIDYYALRNDEGSYRGTLEVSREVSDIRNLEGERRLVDWGE